MSRETQFRTMISVFEQAALLLQHNQHHFARQIVTELHQDIYEKSLRWYNSKTKDYYFYLIRYVHDSIDFQVVCCEKSKAKQTIAFYLEMLTALSSCKPAFVRDEQKLILADPKLLGTYKPKNRAEAKILNQLLHFTA